MIKWQKKSCEHLMSIGVSLLEDGRPYLIKQQFVIVAPDVSRRNGDITAILISTVRSFGTEWSVAVVESTVLYKIYLK